MKVLTGVFKGRLLPFAPKEGLRPTGDKVRKALIDTFQGAIEGMRVLDLYSGTGAMGFESLSNGARSAVFVEKDTPQADQIERTLERWGLAEAGQVMNMDVFRAMDRLSFNKETFHMVFVDPPYQEGRGTEVLRALSENALVVPGGYVVIECAKTEDVPETLGEFERIRDRRYGRTKILIYLRKG